MYVLFMQPPPTETEDDYVHQMQSLREDNESLRRKNHEVGACTCIW